MPGVYGRFTQSYEKEGANQKISFAKTKQRLLKNAIRALRALPYKNIHMKKAEQPRSRAAIRAPTEPSALDRRRTQPEPCTLALSGIFGSVLRQNLDVQTRNRDVLEAQRSAGVFVAAAALLRVSPQQLIVGGGRGVYNPESEI